MYMYIIGRPREAAAAVLAPLAAHAELPPLEDLSICLSVHSVHSVCPSVYLFTCPSVYLSICPFAYL